MCGIAGLLTINGALRDSDPAATALRMVRALPHRGPDGNASWGDPDSGIGLGHGRLAIIDLTPTGVQPMHSANARYVITFNGEVYNFSELRRELETRGHRFQSTSDTEVMLAACVEWGPEAAISRFVGMFAFALFDRQARTLRLVRDRLGVKPLYWTIAGGMLLFGSELRALMVHPAFRRDVDPDAISAVVQYSYVPAPGTVFRGVHKLPPGSILTIQAGREPQIARYWSIADVVARGVSPIGEKDAIDRLDALMRDSVRLRLISDVPIGAFLSGGVDSSAVVALMQSTSDRPVRTFTIGFQDGAYNEAPFAREVARYLGTDHTEVTLDPHAALDLVGNVADWFDEPFADSSQLPTYLVARMTRQHVTVALSGDGGDELFAGYPKYASLDRIWRYAGALPYAARSVLGRALGAMPEALLHKAASLVLDAGRAERIGEKSRRLGEALSAATADEAALAIAKVGFDARQFVNGASQSPAFASAPLSALPDLISRMQVRDIQTYLPDDILTKVDRCSMAVSLEAREPLLDHRLVEFVWSLPLAIRRGDGRPKALLRAVLDRYLPASMTTRPKRGFSIPLGDWLRGPLREWADGLLTPAKLTDHGLFRPDRVQAIWQRHVAGAEQNATGLWNILMVQAWAARWLTR